MNSRIEGGRLLKCMFRFLRFCMGAHTGLMIKAVDSDMKKKSSRLGLL